MSESEAEVAADDFNEFGEKVEVLDDGLIVTTEADGSVRVEVPVPPEPTTWGYNGQETVNIALTLYMTEIDPATYQMVVATMTNIFSGLISMHPEMDAMIDGIKTSMSERSKDELFELIDQWSARPEGGDGDADAQVRGGDQDRAGGPADAEPEDIETEGSNG